MSEVQVHTRHPASEFVPVSSTGGVTVFAPAGGFVSFTNSPYYSHKHGLAIDIYPHRRNATALCPVRGDLVKVFTVRSPRPRHFRAVEEEQLLIIRPVDNPDLVARILHTNFSSSLGTNLSVGTPIGRIVRSGFYDFWTERHIHVEVRDASQPLRAKGSLPMEPLTGESKLLGTPSESPPKLRVVSTSRQYTLVHPENGTVTLNPFTGLGCRVGEVSGILDAGIPHYEFGSVHVERGAKVAPEDDVKLWGAVIGKVSESSRGLVIFKSLPIEVHLNEQVVYGLSLYPWVRRSPLIKLIPVKPDWPNCCKGERITVSIR
jgi:hypothetical protein